MWWRPTTLRSSAQNCLKPISWILITRRLTSWHRKLYWQLIIIASQLLFSVAISWQLNAALYLCGVHKPCPLLRKETAPDARIVNLQFCLCTSVVPRLMSVVFGLGTRLHVHMHTKLENGVLHNGQQPQSVVNGFYSPGWIWSYEVVEWLGSCAFWWVSISC